MALDQLIEEGAGLAGILDEVDEELVHPAEVLPPFEEVGPEGDHDGVIGRLVEVLCPAADLGQVLGRQRLVVGRRRERRPGDMVHEVRQPVEDGGIAVPVEERKRVWLR